MEHHRFQVGDKVSLMGDRRAMAYGSGYTVSRQLPPMRIEPRYRIKRSVETYERVAEEHELRCAALGSITGAMMRRVFRGEARATLTSGSDITMKHFVPPIVIPIFRIIAILAYSAYRHGSASILESHAVSESPSPRATVE